MRKPTLPFALALALLLAAPAATRADVLLVPPPTVAGPGGSGTAGVDPGNPSTLLVEKEYTGPGHLDLTFTVDGADVYAILEIILNSAGATWTGFRYDIIAAPAGSEFFLAIDFAGRFGGAIPDAGPLITSFTFVDGAVADGDGFAPGIGLFVADAGEVTIRQTAIVPEPSSLALACGLGMSLTAGLALRRRRRHMA